VMSLSNYVFDAFMFDVFGIVLIVLSYRL